MRPDYTVVWSPATEGTLTQLWLDNPAIRSEITSAAAEIGAALRHVPGSIGIAAPGSTRSRIVVRPPISVLYQVSEEDRLVQVIGIKLWDE